LFKKFENKKKKPFEVGVRTICGIKRWGIQKLDLVEFRKKSSESTAEEK